MSRNAIYQISRKPIPKDTYICEEDYYDDGEDYSSHASLHAVSDFVEDLCSQEEILDMYSLLGNYPGISVDPEAGTFTVVSKEEYFRGKFCTFRKELEILSHMTLPQMCTGEFDMDLYTLRNAYEDAVADYVDDGGEGYGFLTLDKFIRLNATKDGDTFYLGGVVMYHC